MPKPPERTYKSAGVDLDLYRETMQKIPKHLARTQEAFHDRIMSLPEGFAGLFRLKGDSKQYDDPVLVSGTDGVGTKLKVAFLTGKFDTVGIDLVAMCVNDCLCLGAEPLFFLDYLALDRDDPERIENLVQGVTEGCLQAGAALLGGETAIMPDVYAPDEFDMAGFCVGVVERNRVIDGKDIRPKDKIVGLASSGFHSNGYSLIRKVVFDIAGLKVDDRVEELETTVAELLLKPTTIYTKSIQEIVNHPRGVIGVNGIAHITGGGLAENLQRILPEGCLAMVDKKSWQIPACFDWLQRLGHIAEDEMFRVFNMGIGLALVVRPLQAENVCKQLEELGTGYSVIGEIVEGTRGVDLR